MAPPRASEIWPSLKARLMSQVEVREDGCWIWTGNTDKDGYGRFIWDGQQIRAHRASYEIHKGPIAKGKWVLHTCDVTACCNPDHLIEGVAADNTADMIAKGRKAVLRGQVRSSSRLTESDVREIRKALAEGLYSQEIIGMTYGVSTSAINRINVGKMWDWLPDEEETRS